MSRRYSLPGEGRGRQEGRVSGFRVLAPLRMGAVAGCCAALALGACSAQPAHAATSVAAEQGRVKVRCKVAQDHRLSSCEVISEDPLGRGFGDGALRMAQRLSYPQLPVGANVVVPLLIKLPATPPAEAALAPAVRREVQCMVFATQVAANSDPAAAKAGQLATAYFIGKIAALDPQIDLRAAVGLVQSGHDPDASIREVCSAELQNMARQMKAFVGGS